MARRLFAAFLATACLTLPAAAQAQTPAPGPNPQAEAQALDLLKHGIAFKTVEGPANQTFDYATYLKSELVAGGFAEEDVTVTKLGDTAYLVARYRGTGKAKGGAKPLYLSGHMDVVAANPKDWERDPFTPVIENGYIFGRGATDMKYDLSTMIATLIQLKREGFKPGRDILLLASGDEETDMKTTAALAEQYHDGELLLNIDGGGGAMGEDGKPLGFGIDGAEKTYADFELTYTNAGGHSSAPRPVNAIYQLSAALTKIGDYKFPGQVNEITRASLAASAEGAPPEIAEAIRRFLADQTDPQALSVLRAAPGFVGQIGTTCVATMVDAGHARNALPQRATANVNCRIFPGTPVKDVQATLAQVVGDPEMKIVEVDTGSIASPASPLRPDLMALVTKAIHARYPGIPVVPSMASGASDSMHFRARGVPSYGVSPIFMKGSDSFSHGLNERTPLSEISPSIVYYKTLLTTLAK
ncbi:M20/M25/M40 family metallo-hydrolase [Sphingomonas sp.]|uniref:M20/M25/M40 family metallo-hydrolase n=1 Tax=Sphingomonas sp. TaxID=28214 RepID=UPI001B1FF37E|nr:M20/M25/M40 family metallo-hydrolase [Sphingomonas sp.]MBO9711429.1 M20/M25/M40 family metallo-hydrolase [Sphingomonas sp.]